MNTLGICDVMINPFPLITNVSKVESVKTTAYIRTLLRKALRINVLFIVLSITLYTFMFMFLFVFRKYISIKNYKRDTNAAEKGI